MIERTILFGKESLLDMLRLENHIYTKESWVNQAFLDGEMLIMFTLSME